MLNISLIRTVEGAKVSPTSLENPALRVLSQIHSSNLQFHLFRQNWIDLWSFGGQRFHSGWLVWTEGTEEPDRGCNTGRWYSCGEERTQSRLCAGQRMRALMRYQPPSVHNTLLGGICSRLGSSNKTLPALLYLGNVEINYKEVRFSLSKECKQSNICSWQCIVLIR